MRVSHSYTIMIALLFAGMVGMVVTGEGSDAGRRTPEPSPVATMSDARIAAGVALPQPSAPAASVTPTPLVVTAAFAAPEPTPEPTAAPTPAAAPIPGTLSREEFLSVALTVGYPPELAKEAFRVACGGGSTRWGESSCHIDPPSSHYGLMQISGEWADYCGVDAWTLTSPSVNLACALMILEYEQSIGVEPWHNWQVKPD